MVTDPVKILDIAGILLAGMPSEFAKITTDEQAAKWALRRATALVMAFEEGMVEVQ